MHVHAQQTTDAHAQCCYVCTHTEIVLKFCFGNRKFVISLSLKFKKDSFSGCVEIQILAQSVYLLAFFLFSPNEEIRQNVRDFEHLCKLVYNY